jgi:hypothetical protein
MCTCVCEDGEDGEGPGSESPSLCAYVREEGGDREGPEGYGLRSARQFVPVQKSTFTHT